MWNNGNNCGGYPYYQTGSYYGGGYTTPMYQQSSPQPSVQPQQSINTNKIYVNGVEDVRCRQLPAGSDFIFLDNDKPLIYRKTTDSTGKMDVQVFKITPYQEEEKPQPSIDVSNFVSVEDFHKLEEQFNELRESLKTEPAKSPSTKKTV